jgi:S-(hydroxymethyl)glutathione dehydrogenase / alcohol dehydrogenase
MTVIDRPRTCRAAILVAQHAPLVIDEIELPDRLHAGQVLVRIHYSGICGSQLGEIDGVKGPDAYLPHLLGHEAGATVVEVGPGVTHVAPGDHVVVHWRKGAGIEAAPPGYRWQGRKLNAGWATTFNEYAVVSENRVTAIDRSFDLGLAALFGCPVTTGLGVVTNDAKLRIGESIVVIGTGGVGLSVIVGAAMASAYPIVACDRYPNRLALARRLGATHTLLAGDGDLLDGARAIVGAAGADVVVEHTGDVGMIRTAWELTHPRGRTLLVGVPHRDQEASIYTLPLHFGKVLTGSHGGSSQPDVDIPRYARLHEAGRLDLAALVTDRFPLDDINTAIAGMRDGSIAGRCLIEVAPPERTRP